MSKNYIPFLLLLLVGFLSITWFKGNFIINHRDQCFSLSPLEDFYTFGCYIWNDLFSTGTYLSSYIAGFFYFGLLAFLQQCLHFSLVVCEKLLYYLLFTFSGINMYYLAFSISKDKNQLAALFSAFFYMFNFYLLFLIYWDGFTTPAGFCYSILPLLLSLYIKVITSNNKLSLIVLLIFSTVFFSFAATLPTYVVIFFISICSYLFFFCLLNLIENHIAKIERAILMSFFLCFLWVFLNIWWILPLIFSIKSQLAIARTTDSMDVFEIWSSQTSFLNLFRLMGAWIFNAKQAGDILFPWMNIYSTPIFSVISFIPLVLAVCSFLRKQKDEMIFFFAIIFLLGLFLMKGLHSPWKNVNKWIFIHIPFFEIFRNQYEKFGILVTLSYAILIGYGWKVICDVVNKTCAYLLSALVGVILFGIYMWPFWSGDVIYKGGKKIPSARVKIPVYYYKSRDWIKKKKEQFRLVSLPHQENGVAYRWKHGYMGADDVTLRLLRRSILGLFKPQDEVIRNYLSNLFDPSRFHKRRFRSIVKPLKLINVKYLLVHEDVNYYVNTPYGKEEKKIIYFLENSLDTQLKISIEKSFGKLKFYRIPEEYFLPRIYSFITFILVNSNTETIIPMSETKYLDGKPVLLFTEQNELFSASQLSISNVIFKDSIPEDLVIELGGEKWQMKKESNLNWQKKFRVKKTGVYEIWMENGNRKNRKWEIEIDEKKLVYSFRSLPDNEKDDKERKYIKIGEIKLKKGKHIINVKCQDVNIENKEQDLKIVLVNKKERERLEKEIWRKINDPKTELCYIFEKEKGEFFVN